MAYSFAASVWSGNTLIKGGNWLKNNNTIIISFSFYKYAFLALPFI